MKGVTKEQLSQIRAYFYIPVNLPLKANNIVFVKVTHYTCLEKCQQSFVSIGGHTEQNCVLLIFGENKMK